MSTPRFEEEALVEAVRQLKEKLLAEDLEELDNELEPEEGLEGRPAGDFA